MWYIIIYYRSFIIDSKWPKVCGQPSSLNATEYNDVLDINVLSPLCQKFEEVAFLFQHDDPAVHKASSVKKKWLSKFGVEEHD